MYVKSQKFPLGTSSATSTIISNCKKFVMVLKKIWSVWRRCIEFRWVLLFCQVFNVFIINCLL